MVPKHYVEHVKFLEASVPMKMAGRPFQKVLAILLAPRAPNVAFAPPHRKQRYDCHPPNAFCLPFSKLYPLGSRLESLG